MQMNSRWFALIGSLLGFAAVALGAFGAHGLRKMLDAEMLAIFETGVRYQFYHALALLVTSLAPLLKCRLVRASQVLFVTGVLIFSGSLYILALSGVRWWGAVTPVGGVCLLGGWVTLSVALFRKT